MTKCARAWTPGARGYQPSAPTCKIWWRSMVASKKSRPKPGKPTAMRVQRGVGGAGKVAHIQRAKGEFQGVAVVCCRDCPKNETFQGDVVGSMTLLRAAAGWRMGTDGYYRCADCAKGYRPPRT
jgi:hypothetical protein